MDKKLSAQQPILRIGKRGLTDSVIDEIRLQLKKRKLIKIKILKSALEEIDRKSMAKRIAHETDSELVELKGLVAVYYKR